MKKIIKLFLCLFIVFNIAACSNTDKEENNQTEQTNESQSTSSLKEYNIEVYSDSYATFTLKSISLEEIIFDVENNYTETISPILNIALDGEDISGWESNNDISAGEKKELVYNVTDLNYIDHKYMSIYGMIFLDSGGSRTFDICDLEIGENENHENNISSGEEIFSSNKVTVEYAGANAEGLTFSIENFTEETIQVYFKSLYINDDSEDYSLYTCYIPAHSKAEFYNDILSINSDYYYSDIETIFGEMRIENDSDGLIERFEFNIENNES